jgi:hypothetical protein
LAISCTIAFEAKRIPIDMSSDPFFGCQRCRITY